ncbi:tRNA ligases class II (D, K and N) domain-containing protein, partial [Toxoplasma gondii RUB]
WLLSLFPAVLSSPSVLHEKFRDLPAGEAAAPDLVAVAGRIQSIRNGGMFIDLFSPSDESKLQLFVSLSAAAPSASRHSLADSADHAPAQGLSPSASALSGDLARLGSPTSSLPHTLPAVAILPFLDLGDFLLARGHIRRTQRNELTLDVARVGGLHLVAKRLLPLDLSLSLSLSLSRSLALPRVSPGSKSPSAVSFSEGRRAGRRGRAPPLDTGAAVLSATDVLQGGELRPASLRAAAARAHAAPFSAAAGSAWADGPASVSAALRSLPSPQRDAQILCSGRLREILRLRSFIIQTVREKLLSEAFLEVDTAVLHGAPHARASNEKEAKAETAEQEEKASGRAGEEDGFDGSGYSLQTQQTSTGQKWKEKREDQTVEGRSENEEEKDTPTARLFESHLHALDLPVHLRIAPELALKRLVVSGVSDKVFEIGRCFRNEGISWRHQPEFLSMEAYATFWTYEDMMTLTEEIVRLCACRIASLRTQASCAAESRAPPPSSPVSSPSSSRFSFLSSLLSYTPWGRSKAAEADVRGPRTARDASKTREGVDDRESRISWQGHEINLSGPWRRMTMVEALHEYTGIHFERLSHQEALLEVERRLQECPEKEGLEHRSSISPSPLSLDGKGEDKRKVTRAKQSCGKALPPACLTSVEELMDFTFKEWVESRLTQPTHIIHTPLALSPLAAEKLPEEGKFPVAERFETYIAGMELADGYSELTDPLEQLRRFHSQQRIAKGTDTPATGPGRTTPETLEANNQAEARSQEEAKADGAVPNQEFVSALMLGLPPTAGLGIGLDRLVMLLTDSAFIRDVVHMPLRKSVL